MCKDRCYWGLGTKGSQIAWFLVALAVVVGVSCWIPGLIEFRKCVNKLYNCDCKTLPNGPQQCKSQNSGNSEPGRFGNPSSENECVIQYVKCIRTPVVVWTVGWFFLFFVSWLPCLYFCCCAKGPGMNQSNVMYPSGAHTVQMAPQPYGTMSPHHHQQQQQYYAAGPGGYPPSSQMYPGAPAMMDPSSSHPSGYPGYPMGPQMYNGPGAQLPSQGPALQQGVPQQHPPYPGDMSSAQFPQQQQQQQQQQPPPGPYPPSQGPTVSKY